MLLPEEHVPSYAFIGSYSPRRCGIGTFTANLCESVNSFVKENGKVFAVAVNDRPQGYAYPPRVRFELQQTSQADYRLAAEFLNVHQVSTVCLQHEYGIFGGHCGSSVLMLLKRLRRPLVTTLHTILKQPSEPQRLIMQEIAQRSHRLVVMSEVGREFLENIYNVQPQKIVLIPHGIPDMPFIDPNYFKDQFAAEGRKVLLTFGLLSPGKGLELVIEALPQIVRKHPEVLYIILGATHPQIKRESGEQYRNGLFRRVNELGMGEHVQFQNRFVEMDELMEFLGCADIYITPYINEAQVVSGTLAYALGAGKAVISTPYWHAQEMLADGRGRIVPFNDAGAIADQVIDLLDNETERHAIRKRAYNYTRKCVFSNVAAQYVELFEEARESWSTRDVVQIPVTRGNDKADDLPEPDFRHLRMLTDDTGILQHCSGTTPDRRHGYCTDDNARALIVTATYWEQTRDTSMIPLMQTYLAFLMHAMDEQTGRFRNFMNFDRTWPETIGSEDAHARALWGLGIGVAYCPHESMIALASRLFLSALPASETFSSPRSWAFTIAGIHGYLRRFGGDSEVRRYRAMLTDRLEQVFCQNSTPQWPWCEDIITYANAKLPHALMMSGKWMDRGDLINMGVTCLDWLLEIQSGEHKMLSIIGSDGWCKRDGFRARFDQQPIEAHALVDACIEAYHVTGQSRWADQARRCFNWFLGENDLRMPVYDFTTGGCRDGLQVDRVNENQGAESTLAWLMSLLLMHDLQMELALRQLPVGEKIPEPKPLNEPINAGGPAVGAIT